MLLFGPLLFSEAAMITGYRCKVQTFALSSRAFIAVRIPADRQDSESNETRRRIGILGHRQVRKEIDVLQTRSDFPYNPAAWKFNLQDLLNARR